jgi:hypothetical protein
VVPKCIADDLPEQQPSEGKCPTLPYNSLSCIILLKPKD